MKEKLAKIKSMAEEALGSAKTLDTLKSFALSSWAKGRAYRRYEGDGCAFTRRTPENRSAR